MSRTLSDALQEERFCAPCTRKSPNGPSKNLLLVAHPCGDPSRNTVSRIECRIKFPQNRRCRAKIALHPANFGGPQIKVSHLFLRTPPVALSSRSQQAGGAAGWWRVSRHFWVLKTDRATGGYRSYAAAVTPVALLCATKNLLKTSQAS